MIFLGHNESLRRKRRAGPGNRGPARPFGCGEPIYEARSLIFLLLRFKRRILFLRHCSIIKEGSGVSRGCSLDLKKSGTREFFGFSKRSVAQKARENMIKKYLKLFRGP